MKISAVILSYKNFEGTTKLCLDSILSQIENKNIKLKVFDNYSPDDTPEKLKEYHSKIGGFDLILNNKNIGFAAGFNKAFKKENSDWVLIIDSDTQFPNGSIGAMIDVLKNAKSNQQIISPVTNNAGTCQHLYFTSGDSIKIISEGIKLANAATKALIPIYRSDFFCVALKSELWNKLSGLAEDYGPGYFEDFDFCMRSRSLGVNCFMSEKWFVYHQGSASFKHNSDQKKLIKLNRKIFLSKFPCAEMRHRRDDVYKLVEFYIENSINSGLMYENRTQYLLNDNPRSFFKRIVWKMKIKKILHVI